MPHVGTITQLTPKLWMGGALAELPFEFDLMIDCYGREPYDIDPYRTFRLTMPFYDGPAFPAPDKLYAAADLAESYIRSDRTVLVHCQGGWNRSGLIVALTLRQLGHSLSEALTIMRTRDPHVLCNQTFIGFLSSHLE